MMPSFYEIAGNILMVLSVYLAARNHVLTWPAGIIGCVFYALMFFDVKLYADVTLQVFFIATSLHGWMLWRQSQSRPVLPVTPITGNSLLLLYLPAAIILAMLYGALLHGFTDASLPFIDSLVLTFSITAQFLLMRRKLQTWHFWIVVDVLSVGLFAYKELYLTSAVYFLFLLNAAYGLYRWRKIVEKP